VFILVRCTVIKIASYLWKVTNLNLPRLRFGFLYVCLCVLALQLAAPGGGRPSGSAKFHQHLLVTLQDDGSAGG